MAIRPTKFNADGSVDVWHDELGHGGTLQASDLAWARGADGTPNTDYAVVPCPFAGCTSHSVHPISGGCDPRRVQFLFALAHRRRLLAADPTTTWAQVKTFVRNRVAAMDGLPRWQIANAAPTDTDPTP